MNKQVDENTCGNCGHPKIQHFDTLGRSKGCTHRITVSQRCGCEKFVPSSSEPSRRVRTFIIIVVVALIVVGSWVSKKLTNIVDKSRQEIVAENKKTKEEFDFKILQAKKVTGELCPETVITVVPSLWGQGASNIIVMGQLIDPSKQFDFRANADKVELFVFDLTKIEWVKVAEKYNTDSQFCLERTRTPNLFRGK